MRSVLAPAAPYLALFAAGTFLAAPLRLPLPGAAAGLLLALVALRVGVMLDAVRDVPGEEARGGTEKPARRAALHAAHV